MIKTKPIDSGAQILEPLLDQNDNNTQVVNNNNEWFSTYSSANQRKFRDKILRYCTTKNVVSSTINILNRRRLTIVVLVLLCVVFLFANSIRTSDDENISVIHYSHVPGMKDHLFKLDKLLQRINVNISGLMTFEPIERNLSLQQEATPITRVYRSTNVDEVVQVPTTEIPSRTNLELYFQNSLNISTNYPKGVSTNLLTVTLPTPPPPSGYLVWSDQCKIPNIDPYTHDVMKYFHRQKYKSCSTAKPLTSVLFNTTTNKYVLLLNGNQIENYAPKRDQLECCYKVIERKSKGKKADADVRLSDCVTFRNRVELPFDVDNILVQCKSNQKQTYINGHAMMPERPQIRNRINKWKQVTDIKPISVLMVGIDSISRLNLIRSMPKTAQYLYDNEWFEMSGYNKIDDNTFPNFMALLAGFNQTTAFHRCTPTKVGALDKCPLIWKTFRELGYVTAYAEDEAAINTFNYLKVGFEKPPVDYYLRPFLISAESHLGTQKRSGLTFCLGYKHSADYIYDYALELATRYRDDPFFGLFWTNTFSHNAISDCSSMDEKMAEYLKRFSDHGILNQTIAVFFSDHGIRFGPTRKLSSGPYEERLPFMFIWLPPTLKNSHPEFVNALSVNKNRLTNPFDVHMTLKHVLELSGRTKNLPPAEDCPKCQTLLKPVPHSRSCDDAAIEAHWCTCLFYTSIYKDSVFVKKVATFVVDYINDYVAEYKNGTVLEKCAVLSLDSVQNASYASIPTSSGTNTTGEVYQIIFTTKPNGGLFEATVRYTGETGTMRITGNVSRLNAYASDSYCISDGGAKKFCSCGRGVRRPIPRQRRK